jgi:phospholipase/carboxylesterase
MDQPLDAVVLNPTGKPTATVIWLHGLGADGHDFEPIVPELRLPADHRIRFVFPHAPRRPVTINGGLVMPAWYDVRSPDLRREEDETGIQDSTRMIEGFIAHQTAQGIPVDRILLAGFSQGGAIALHCGLRQSQALAGILALSTYLPLPNSLESEAHEANKAVPIFMAHGVADPVIPHHQGWQSCIFLKGLGYTVTWRDYPMQHSVCLAEIADISAWLQERFRD